MCGKCVRRHLVRKRIRRASSSVKYDGSGATSAEGDSKVCRSTASGEEAAADYGRCERFSAGSGPLIMGGLEHQGSSESLSGVGFTSPRLSDATVTDETAAAAAAPTAYTTMDVAVKEAAAAAASKRNPSGSTVRTVKFAPSVPSSASTAASKATYMAAAAGGIRAGPPVPGGGEQATLEVERSSCPAAARSRPPDTGASTMVPFLLSKAATDASGAARRRGQKQRSALERRQSCPAPSWDPMLEVARVAGRVQSSEIGGGERLELLEVSN